MAFVQYHHVNEKLVGVSSFFANSILFVVIIHETNETLRPYARVLLINCVLDMLYTLVTVACELQMEIWDGYIIVNVQNRLLRSAPAPTHFLMLWTLTFIIATTINGSPLIFYFRYMLICKSRHLNVKQLLCILIIPLSYAAMEATALTAALIQHDSERDTLCPQLMNDTIWKMEGGEYSPEKCMLSTVLNPFIMFFFVAAFIFDIAIYVAMGYFSYAVYYTIKESTYLWRTKLLQHQMNWMLCAQMVVPLFTAIIPVGVLAIFPILYVNGRGVGTLVCMCMSWVPLVSPVTTIAFVANFRRRAIRYLFFFPKRLHYKFAMDSFRRHSSFSCPKKSNTRHAALFSIDGMATSSVSYRPS